MTKWRVIVELNDFDSGYDSLQVQRAVREALDYDLDDDLEVVRLTIEPLSVVVKETDPTTGITHWKGMES